jgi:hypothetical protein
MGGFKGDGWLERWVVPSEMGGFNGDRWLKREKVAKLVARLLATAALIYLINTKWAT